MAEDDWREEDDRFRAFSGSLPLGIFEADRSGRVVFVNARWCELSGISAEQAKTGAWIDAIHPDDRARLREAYAARRGGERPSGELSPPFRFVHEGGAEVWVRSASSAVLDDAGNVKGLLGFVVDITDTKRHEAAQRASDERYRKIVDTAAEGIWVIDAAGMTTFTNQRMATMLGWTPAEMVARPLLDFMDDEGRAIAAANLERRQQGITEELDFKFTHRDGLAVWTMVSTTPLHDVRGGYAGALAMVTDISVRRLAEERIRELNADLQRRNQQLELANRELESFSYSVSHDLRAPLRAIDGFSLALLTDAGDALDEQSRDHLLRVRRATHTMGQLIDDLIQLARVSRTEIREAGVDLGALAAEIAVGLRAIDPARDVELSIAPDLVVWGDERLLRTLLDNLLGNAFKYTGKRPRARIEIGARVERGERVFFVRDDGAGFDMAHAGKLFTAFQRLHSEREFPGTGIGLATAARIVGRHGGRIWAVGAPGEGATFSFVLGARREPGSSAPPG